MHTDTAWKASAGAFLRLLLIAMAGLAALGAPVLAQPEEKEEELDLRPVTRTFAIRNARIVQAPGKVLQRGTVVVRDGLIVAVGEGIAIPFDARVIEGDSMVVYAGFIDGLSHGGVPKPKEEKEGKGDGVRAGDPPNDIAGITPDRDVRDLIAPKDPTVDSLRMLGFTVAHVVPRGKMLPGAGAIISLAGEKPGEMVLRGDASLYARFAPADDMYPATSMAIMAKWRQLYREAERRKGHHSSYSENPGGIERPKYDPVLDAFFPVIDGRTPVFFEGEGPLEVHRILALRKDLEFPLVIAGLKNAADITDVLKAANVPVFLSLDLPKEKKKEVDSASKKGGDSLALDTARGVTPSPPADFFVNDRRIFSYKDVIDEHKWLDRRQQAIRRLHYATPGALLKDGIRFGFSTAGAKLGDVRENLRLVVKNGLSEDAALAALTIDAARLLGLDKSLGTVEKGKIGNLLVTKGSYFDEKSLVRYVFVDGRMFEYNADAKIAKKDSAAAAADSLASKVIPDDTLRVNPILAKRRDANATGNLLVRNGTVLTVTKGTMEKTDILVRDGKIAQIGQGISAPAGFDTIDATGMYVMPGVIDAHSHIAISDVNEWTNPVTAEVSVGDVIDPYDIAIYRALGGGVTTSHVMHGSANVIGGQCETIKHRYGTIDPAGLVMEGAPRTIKFALGENPTRVHGRGYNVHPSTRMGVEEVMRQAFTDAKRYMEAKGRYERDRKKDSRSVGPQYDLRLETLAAILRGEILVHCHSYRADEILMVMRVFRDFGIERVVFQHVNEGFKVAPELAKFGAMASVFSDWWAYKFEVYYSTAYNATILTRNGVTASINSDSPELNRHLYHEASKTMKYGGLEADEALKLITINPARQLGIENRVGSIEVGKEADLAIFSAHPLSIYAICQKTVVDGVIRFDRATDPDDMRLYIDPKQSIETATIWKEHEDRCMQGTEKHFMDLMHEH